MLVSVGVIHGLAVETVAPALFPHVNGLLPAAVSVNDFGTQLEAASLVTVGPVGFDTTR